ncbi:MAG TPA: glycine--tRNA ligase subunit beta [Polyangiaceae bacterium LLY-WYZ-14_1]|nr:glycine--tRNA ligase subunit beta [Polyangiaceae bacterium LLY-WYZ-14_1]
MGEPLVFEVGVEELPVSFLDRALGAMPELAGERLASARLDHGALRAVGTPRRLTLLVEDLAATQRDLDEQVLGPPTRIALDDDGKLTKAGLGFAKKQGVSPDDVRVIETDKGRYVGFDRHEAGRPAGEVLPELLADLARQIPFPKVMRWGAGEIAFGRPVHWLVALHGQASIDVRFAGARSGPASRGHRFLAPGEVPIPEAGSYLDRLREAHVLADPAERRSRMDALLADAAAVLGGSLVPDPFLVNECASLVEEPFVVPGRFDEGFLALPEQLVVSVMRDHQRYFAVRGGDGSLLPRYLNVVNTALAPETIAQGNDRVLRARLADARFFVQEDAKRPLASRVDGLDGVVFQKKLGSLGDKVRRLAILAPALAAEVDRSAAAPAREAALLCKADLLTLIVGEFPELEGDMGRHYALADGVASPVADAIRDHHRPRGASDQVPTELLGAALAVADRADTLVGCFGIGLVPSGSADPYGLRRAALGILRIAREGPLDVDLQALSAAAHRAYGEVAAVGEGPAHAEGAASPLAQDEQVLPKVDEFFRARLRAIYGEDHPGDLVEACLAAWDGRSVRDLDARVAAVARFRTLPAYASLSVAFKRTFNIAGELDDREPPDPAAFLDDAEKELGARFAAVEPEVREATAVGDYTLALTRIAEELREPIDRFFDEVLVMAEDEAIRRNRLRLVARIARTLTGIAHFHLLSTKSPEAAGESA